VDVNPTAVWLCELRLWLSTAIQDPELDPMKVVPLPNLDRNIRVGDSLAGGSFRESSWIPQPARIAAARARYTRAVGRRKLASARILDRLERGCAIGALDREIERLGFERREMLGALRSPDLFGERRRPSLPMRTRLDELRQLSRSAHSARRALARGGALPFSFATQFADVAATGGFDIVIGNPPWVRVHNVDDRAKDFLYREFVAVRESAWQRGAEAASAGRGFAAQVDLAALFAERAVTLVREGGTIALLVPAKLWRSLAGGGIRSHLLEETNIVELHDLTESPQLFDAAVYPSILVARRTCSEVDAHPADTIRAVVHHRKSVIHWTLDGRCLPFDTTPGSPWLILPPEVRAAFNRVRDAGVSMAESAVGRPLLGVKTGCNEAFVVRLSAEQPQRTLENAHDVASVESADTIGLVEHQLLRPLHRGETIRPWKLGPSPEKIIWTHGAHGPLPQLPPRTLEWLGSWKRELERRSDVRGRAPWWTIFRTDSATTASPRVAWSDFGRSPRAAVLAAGDSTVLLNSCYVAHCNDLTDAFTLAALLNSPVIASWLNALAEPARGGYHRYLGWTVALMPVPTGWTDARRILAPLAERAMCGEAPSADALLAATIEAYGLRKREVEPLLLWNGR